MAEGVEAGPPILMERLVVALIPPGAREAVAGDLRELYISPRQYAWDAARVLPLVIASQMRRNTNWPVLGLQALLLYACLGGLKALSYGGAIPARGAAAVLAIFFVLLLGDVYRGLARPSPRLSAVIMVSVAASILFLSQAMLFGLMDSHRITAEWFRWMRFIAFGPAVFPILCILRLGVMRESDWNQGFVPRDRSVAEMAADYRRFARRAALRNRAEGGVAIIAMAIATALLRPVAPAAAAMLFAGFTAAALYLLVDGAARPLAAAADFLSLRAHYQRELARQHQIRRFMWWLWFGPLFVGLYIMLIARGLMTAQPFLAVIGLGLAQILCFFLAAFNRERSAHIQERIDFLDELRERQAHLSQL